MYSLRIQKLQELVRKSFLEAFLVTKKENIQWLTGFDGSFGYVIVTPSHCTLITDPRYQDLGRKKAKESLCRFELWDSVFPTRFAKVQKGHWGLEESMTLQQKKILKKVFSSVRWKSFDNLVEDMRSQKDTSEIYCIKQAQKRIDEVLLPLLREKLKVGVTEKQLAFDLEIAIRSGGDFGISFPLIVAFGEHTATAHHIPTDRTLQTHEPVLIDCGATYHGYCSDMTRNFSLGNPSPEYQNHFHLLLDVQQKTIQKCTPQAKVADIDEYCRKALGPLQELFSHSLGHGVGMEIHEMPRISHKNKKEKLLPHQVITIEPGIYLAGQYGIRIEDLILISSEGPEVLSKTPNHLVVF